MRLTTKLFTLIFLCISLSGCGAAATGIGIVLMSGDDSDNNGSPTATIVEPSTSQDVNDLVSIVYTLADGESESVNLVVEYSLDGTTFSTATELAGTTVDTSSDGLVSLSTSPSGVQHTFVWNSFIDVPAANVSVTIRLTPTDSAGNTGTPVTRTIQLQNRYMTSILGRIPSGSIDSPFRPLHLAVRTDTKTLFITNEKSHAVLSMDLETGAIKRLSGTGLTTSNGDDIKAEEANLGRPCQIDFTNQLSSDPTIYFADFSNQRIREINLTTNFITTLAGNGTPGYFEDSTFNLPTSTQLLFPYGTLVVRSSGIQGVFLAEPGSRTIRFVNQAPTPANFYTGGSAITVQANEIRTIAGNIFGSFSRNDGTIDTTSNPPGAGTATFGFPRAIRFIRNPQPLLYVADEDSIRVINLGSSAKTIFPNSSSPIIVNPGEVRTILNRNATPTFIEDNENTPLFAPDTQPGEVGDMILVQSGPNEDIIFSEEGAHSVWEIDGDNGEIRRLAGSERFGDTGDGGPALEARLAGPTGLVMNGDFLLIADTQNNKIKAVNRGGSTQTIAGKTIPRDGIATIATGPSAQDTDLVLPTEIAVDPQNNDAYICDRLGNRIVRFNRTTRVAERVAGNGLGVSEGDGGPAADASFRQPGGIAIHSSGSTKALFICDIGSFSTSTPGRIRMVNLGATNLSYGAVSNLAPGNIQTLVGGGATTSNGVNNDMDNVPVADVGLGTVHDVLLDSPTTGLPAVYILDEPDFGTYRILVYNPNSYSLTYNINGTTRTVNGGSVSAIALGVSGGQNNFSELMNMDNFDGVRRMASRGAASNNGADTDLILITPLNQNHVVVAFNYDNDNQQLLGVSGGIPGGQGHILAGELNQEGYNGDGILATSARLQAPEGVFYVAQGTNNPEILTISDTFNNRIRVINGAGSGGALAQTISTFAGNGGLGGYNGETLPPENSALNQPNHMFGFSIQDVNGNEVFLILVSDSNNGRIRQFVAGGNN